MRPIYQSERSVEGLSTRFLIQSFSDRIVVLVTQLGKVGCLVWHDLSHGFKEDIGLSVR